MDTLIENMYDILHIYAEDIILIYSSRMSSIFYYSSTCDKYRSYQNELLPN